MDNIDNTENTNNDGHPDDPPKPDDNVLTSPKFVALCEALQVLYIRGNQSGRIYFNKEWPDVAAFILGPELVDIDTHGSNDRELRGRLEEEAEARQYHLQDLFETLEDKSARSGVLQTEYVEAVIEQLGRELSLFVYTDAIVDRYAPEVAAAPEPAPIPEAEASPAAPAAAVEDTAAVAVEAVEAVSVEEKPAPAPREPRSVSGQILVEKA